MKTYTNLFENAISLENLLQAWDEFKKGKRNKQDVQEFERHLEDNLFELYEDLQSKKYKHGEYSRFYIKDPKIRLIHKAVVRDRIVHHLVYAFLNPIFEPTFISDSYSCRKRKGTHRAVIRLQKFSNKVYQTHGQCFALKCDIKKFFHSIDHAILLKNGSDHSRSHRVNVSPNPQSQRSNRPKRFENQAPTTPPQDGAPHFGSAKSSKL